MKSLNNFALTTSMSADGTEIVLTASKNDHEGRQTVVLRFTAEEAELLRGEIKGQCVKAKERRKAIRRAEVEAAGKASN